MKSIKRKSVDNDGEYLHSLQVCLFIQRDPSRVNHHLLIDQRFVLIRLNEAQVAWAREER